MQSRTYAVLAATTTVVVWAAAFPAIGLALREFTPAPLAAVRLGIASIPMLLLLLWKRPSLPTRSDLLRFGLSAGLGIAAYGVLLNSGQQMVSAGAASFLIKMESVVAAALGVWILGESFDRRAWIGTAVCVGGAALIASSQPGGIDLNGGSVLVFGAAVCSGLSFVIQKSLVARYGALTSACINIVFGALLLSPWLGTGIEQLRAASVEGIASVIFLGVFPGAVGFFAWLTTLKFFGAARAANILYLVPPVAVALAFLLGEIPHLRTIAGGLVVLVGVLLVNARHKVPSEKAEATLATDP